MAAVPDAEAIAKGKEEKKRLVLDTIAARCVPTSSIEDLKEIGSALQEGDNLEIDILTGGIANYTYKVFLSSSPTRALFAKLSFPFTQLFPDKPCPLMRTENEYKIMERFQKLAPGCVATPYFCVDIDGMKLLVAQWSTADEQWANQFIDGVVDFRCAKGLAGSVSTLHCSDFDVNFNEKMRPFFRSITSILEDIFQGFFQSEYPEDAVSALANSIGREHFDEISAKYKEALERTEGLVHGDLHVFNIMVGKKPNIETLEQFDEEGNVVLCDWEMSHVGPLGKDIGFFHPFPLACTLAHSANGDARTAESIMDFLDTVWKQYAASMMSQGGKTDEDICGIFRCALGFTGLILLGYYAIGFHLDFLPIDEGNTETLSKVKESLGVMAIKFLRWGFGGYEPNLTLADLRSRFKDTVDERALLLTIKKPQRNRRSSVLRMSGRRVSDSFLHFQKIDRDRLSFISIDGSLLE